MISVQQDINKTRNSQNKTDVHSERNDRKYINYYESVIITDTEESDQSPSRDINKTQATHRIHLD